MNAAEVVIFFATFFSNLRNEELKKQLCMETMSPVEATTFDVVRKRGDLKSEMVGGGLQRFGKNSFIGNRPNIAGSNNSCQRRSYVKQKRLMGLLTKYWKSKSESQGPLQSNEQNLQ